MENGFDPLLAGKGPIAARATIQRLAARSAFSFVSLNAHLESVVDEKSALQSFILERGFWRKTYILIGGDFTGH